MQVNPHTHQLKICDLGGSAKVLVKENPIASWVLVALASFGVLIFHFQSHIVYTTAIDI